VRLFGLFSYLGKALRTSDAATKGAMVSLTKVWALELAPHGISVNAVAPGPIRTALFERANPPGNPRTQRIIDAIPVGRFGEPQDVANAVAFFLDQRSGYVTGQVLYVCGGVTLAPGRQLSGSGAAWRGTAQSPLRTLGMTSSAKRCMESMATAVSMPGQWVLMMR
jgi:hypothetical protein